jgi:hypothetical protein
VTALSRLYFIYYFFYLYPFLSGTAAHLHLVSGHLHWSYFHLLVDVERLGGKEGELWLLVLVGESSFPVLSFRVSQVGEDGSSWVLLCNGWRCVLIPEFTGLARAGQEEL